MSGILEYDKNNIDNVYSTGEVAKILRFGVHTIVSLVDKGILNGYKSLPRKIKRKIVHRDLVSFMIDHDIPLELLIDFLSDEDKDSDDIYSIVRTYTTGQVGKICKMSIQSIKRWIDKGILKGHKIPESNYRRVVHMDLVNIMKENNIPLIYLRNFLNINEN